MQTVRNGPPRWLAQVFAILFCACAAQEHAARPRVTDRAAMSADASTKPPPPTEQQDRKPFSGEIVFRLTAASPGGSQTKDLGELHYFISGAHWKHVDARGETAALYDPESRLIYYFKPEVKTVDATKSEGPVKFEALPDKRVVLGRNCKGVRWTTSDRRITGFYDPELFVDPAPFINHHYGHWAETLTATNGALILWSDMELPQADIISVPVSISPREFDASFWVVPQAQSSDAKTRH